MNLNHLISLSRSFVRAPLTQATYASAPHVMRAAVLRDIKVRSGSVKTLELASDVPVPTVSAGDVLVRVHASSINPLDNQMRLGYAKSIASLKIDSPLILGRECSGIIEKIGQNVWNYKVGDEVVAATAPFRQGSHAEYIAIDESEIARKPKNLTHKEAASLPFTSLTAWNAITIAKIEKGMRVLVLGGSGRVGFTLVSILKNHFDCSITTTSSPQHMHKLHQLGLANDAVINHEQASQLQGTFHAVFDVVGTEQSEATCLKLVRDGGAYITFNGSLVRNTDELGLVAGFAQGLRESACKRVRIHGEARGVRFGYALFAPSGATLSSLMNMAESGKLVADVGQVFPLDQIGKAYEYCTEGSGSGKVIIDTLETVK